MNRTQKISLSLICALALVLFPLSYSSWAQSTKTELQNQAGQADRNTIDENQKNTDQNNSNQNSVDQDRSTDQNVTREAVAVAIDDYDGTECHATEL